MIRRVWPMLALALLLGCAGDPEEPAASRKMAAERFLKGVYGGDGAPIEELAAADIVVSYPAFSAKGRDALREISRGFAARCPEFQTTVHESIEEGDRVVLVWSAEGRCTGPEPSDPSTAAHVRMGGISVYEFNSDGKIVREFGEDSLPGPYGRLSD